MPDERNHEEARIESAHERTMLAEERTFSAWVRTALAAMATGWEPQGCSSPCNLRGW